MVYFYFRLAAAQAELDATMATLHEKQAKLADVEAQVCFSFILVVHSCMQAPFPLVSLVTFPKNSHTTHRLRLLKKRL